MSNHPWKEKLDAYVDGELADEELRDFEAHLSACRNCAIEALDRTQLKRATRAAAMRFSPPPELRQRIATSIAPRRRPVFFLCRPAVAVAVALVLAVAVSAFLLMRRSEREQALAELVDLHVSTLASANPVDVISSDRHTVKPWFQGRLPFTFNLPELNGSEFKLDGGKLVYFRGRPAAQLIYELRKHEFSVFFVQ